MFLLHRVFLTGKTHVEYRKVLNGLFTRKALGYVIVLLHASVSISSPVRPYLLSNVLVFCLRAQCA